MGTRLFAQVAQPLYLQIRSEDLEHALYCANLGQAPFDQADENAENEYAERYQTAYLSEADLNTRHFKRHDVDYIEITPSDQGWHEIHDDTLYGLTEFISTFAKEPRFPCILQTVTLGTGTYGEFCRHSSIDLVFVYEDEIIYLQQGVEEASNSEGKYSGFADLLTGDRDLLRYLATANKCK